MESLTDLYIKLRDPIYRFLLHLTGKADLAEELAQETFLQALTSLPRFRGEARISTWLYGIARNVYLKHMRQEQRRQTLRLEETVSGASDPPAAVEAQEDRVRLLGVLASMPEGYRTALVMREYEGLSYGQIGQIMGHTETWARVTCFRARQMLRVAYLKETGGEKA